MAARPQPTAKFLGGAQDRVTDRIGGTGMFSIFSLLACSAPETQSLDFKSGSGQGPADAETEPAAPGNQDTGTDGEEPEEESPGDGGVDSGEGEETGDAPGSTEDRDDGVCGNQPSSAQVGDCAENFTLPDETGELVSLHDFLGDVIFIDLSSFT